MTTLYFLNRHARVKLDVDRKAFKSFYDDFTVNNRRNELFGSGVWTDPFFPVSWNPRYAARYAYRCICNYCGESYFGCIRTYRSLMGPDNITGLWLSLFRTQEGTDLYTFRLEPKHIRALLYGCRPDNILCNFKILKQ